MPEAPDILERTLEALDLEPLADDVFVGDPGGGRHRLFGGLVAAQTVIAAGRTVDDGRKLHSLHAYFLRPGAPRAALRHQVTRVRDGGSFSTRQVAVSQDGEPILTAVLSFARDEPGLGQQTIVMPSAPEPDGLPDREEERSRRYLNTLGLELAPYESAVEVRLCDPEVVEPGRTAEPRQDNWLRVKGELADDPLLQRAMLVYASDRTLLATARMPYALGRHQLHSVSLDHALWIHGDVSMSDWHLCHSHSPMAAGGRAILFGHLYRRDGVCVATIAQEGLVRVHRPSSSDMPEAPTRAKEGGRSLTTGV